VCEEISIFQSVAARFPLTRERLSCIFLPAERLRGFVKASGRKSGKRKRRRDFLLGLTEGQGREYKRRLTGEMMNFTFDFKENNLSALCSWPLAPCLFIFWQTVAAIFVSREACQRKFQGDKNVFSMISIYAPVMQFSDSIAITSCLGKMPRRKLHHSFLIVCV